MKDSKLDRAFLNVKHSVGDIALLEHVLILCSSNTCFPAPTLARKFVKHVLVWLLHGSLLWLDQLQNFSASNCCRASGIVCDLEEVPDRSLILGNRVVIAHRPNLWGPRGRSRYLILARLRLRPTRRVAVVAPIAGSLTSSGKTSLKDR